MGWLTQACLGLAVSASQGDARRQRRSMSSREYSGMGWAAARFTRPAVLAGEACSMMLSRPRMVLVLPVPGGPCRGAHVVC